MKIHYVDALCGAGKTTAAIEYAVRQARKGQIIILAQPTTDLIRQSKTKIETTIMELGANRRVTCRVITGQTNPGKVHSELESEVPNLAPGTIFLITHAALFGLPYWAPPAGTELIIDEIPQVSLYARLNLPANHRYLFDAIKAEEDDETFDYVKLVAADHKVLKSYLVADDVNDLFRGIAQWALRFDHYDCFGLASKWAGAEKEQFEIFGIMKPEILENFSSVTVMGAHVRSSLMYLLWRPMGVEFEPHPYLSRELQFDRHQLGNRKLTIHYLTERPWSKNLRNRCGIERLAPVVERVMGDEPYVWGANNDARDDLNLKGTWIGNVVHGLNAYRHVHQAVYLSALNGSPAHIAFLSRRYCVNETELREAQAHETSYQVIMRCSLRDPAATADVAVLVPDRQVATSIAANFTGHVVVRQVDHGIPELDREPAEAGRHPKVVKSDATLERLDRQHEIDQYRDWLASQKRALRESGWAAKLPYIGDFAALTFSFWRSIYSTASVDESFESWSEFASFLEGLIGESYQAKGDNTLISPSVFSPVEGVGSTRGLLNVRHAWGLWLDVDGGHLTPDQLEAAFPDLWMISYSTWSGGGRFRTVIPTNQPMNSDIYAALWDVVVERVEAVTGMTSNRKSKKLRYHGIDRSKRPASSLFYLPSKARDPGGTFFHDRRGAVLNVTQMVGRISRPREMIPARRYVNPKSDALLALIAANDAEAAKGERRIDRRPTIHNTDIVPNAALDRYQMSSHPYLDGFSLACAIAARCRRLGIDLSEFDLAGIMQEADGINPSPSRRHHKFSDFAKEARNALRYIR